MKQRRLKKKNHILYNVKEIKVLNININGNVTKHQFDENVEK